VNGWVNEFGSGIGFIPSHAEAAPLLILAACWFERQPTSQTHPSETATRHLP